MIAGELIRERIAAYVVTELLNGEPIGGDDNLLAEGMIDSLGMLRLIAFIQEAYAVEVPPEHFVVENFRTIDAIARYLQRLLSGEA